MQLFFTLKKKNNYLHESFIKKTIWLMKDKASLFSFKFLWFKYGDHSSKWEKKPKSNKKTTLEAPQKSF